MISEIRLRTILLIVLMIGVAVMQWQIFEIRRHINAMKANFTSLQESPR
jgi:hypothetical protein